MKFCSIEKVCAWYLFTRHPHYLQRSSMFSIDDASQFYNFPWDHQYTFLVITSQTLKIAFDFFKKWSADSTSSLKSILLLKCSSLYSKQEGHFDYSICTVKRFLKVNLPFHTSFSCKKRFFNIFQIAIESYLPQGKKFWREENLADLADLVKIRQIKFPPKFTFFRHPPNYIPAKFKDICHPPNFIPAKFIYIYIFF